MFDTTTHPAARTEAEAPISRAPARASDDPWTGFAPGRWQRHVDLRDFIQRNVRPYDAEPDFLRGPTQRTNALWERLGQALAAERENGGVLAVSADVASSITAHAPGYIDRENEIVVGLQTDAPLKRAIMPAGGLRLVEKALESYGFSLDPSIAEIFSRYRKDHNTAVFDAYTQEILACRRNGVVTGLPDAYGRGRIIGDYRRVPLYGVARLLRDKLHQKAELDHAGADEATVRLREELAEQANALKDLSAMARSYGFDIDRPAADAREAVQWLYFAYLAAVKEQNGAAMSLGRVSSFLDVYIERDIEAGLLDEAGAQELIDDLTIKLRIVRFLRPPEYNALFSGDPTWVTECIGGRAMDGRPLVSKSSYRFLQTLHNLGPAPEPNLTVLWSPHLPAPFRRFCAATSIATSAIQYENDDLMRPYWGDDYGIACCVSAMKLGKQMQFFGARANLAKALLYALNGGRDEISGEQVGPAGTVYEGEVLDYDAVMERYEQTLDWLARVYAEAMNVIHTMHDRYSYERLEMALHDRDVFRTMAYGVAGLSVVADSLSAIRHAEVRPVRDPDSGLIVDFETAGDFPTFGNNDARVDELAVEILQTFMGLLRGQPTYRDAEPTLSVLTITSNVVYGKATGSTPDGRKKGEPFAPGANPMHGRDKKGALAAAASVAKLPYEDAQDGISYTFSAVPGALGKRPEEREENLIALIDDYMQRGGHHINVNVLNRETLLDAMEHPEKYPQLTIRVSGYAVNFVKLTREQQQDVVTRTFHGAM